MILSSVFPATSTVTNVLPEWLPIFNLVVGVACLVASLLALGQRRVIPPIAAIALVAASAVLVAGSLFQGGWIDLFAWVIFGTGGRLLALACVVGVWVVGRGSRP